MGRRINVSGKVRKKRRADWGKREGRLGRERWASFGVTLGQVRLKEGVGFGQMGNCVRGRGADH